MSAVQFKNALVSIAMVIGVLAVHGPVCGANLVISPVKVFFDARAKTEKITLRNYDDQDINLQLRVYTWRQDAEGKDVYEETSDIIIFPKMLKIAKGEERIVRLGIKRPTGAAEKTYRLYLQEMPRNTLQATGPAVTMLLRAGIPVFISPSRPEARGKLDPIVMRKGNVGLNVRNEGNRHFFISSVIVRGRAADGKEKFFKELGGWYLLSGSARTYTAAIPRDLCVDLTSLDIAVKTEGFDLKGNLDVEKSMCSP